MRCEAEAPYAQCRCARATLNGSTLADFVFCFVVVVFLFCFLFLFGGGGGCSVLICRSSTNPDDETLSR